MKYLITILLFHFFVISCKDNVEKTPIYSLELPFINLQLETLRDSIAIREERFHLREDNEARIVFHNSVPVKTKYSIVYLHGFAGSYMDGYPVNQLLADTLKANIFYARWGDHGQFPPYSMEDFTPENTWEEAKYALEVGKKLGNQVILLSTSTGGTLATKLAAEYPSDVFAVVNLSPNYKDDQTGASLLNSALGDELAFLVSGGKNKKIEHEEPQAAQYWDTLYPSQALVHLQLLVSSTMIPETFAKVNTPILILYYKKNMIQEDNHVEVNVFDDIVSQFSTPDSLKVLKALKSPETHFLGSKIKTDGYPLVLNEILNFLTEHLNIKV